MIALLLAMLITAMSLGLVGVFYRRRLCFPKRYPHAPGSMGGLSDSEVSRVAAWSREIEAQGFGESCGEYRAEVELTPGGIRQIIQHRAWLSPDRRHWAFVKSVTSMEPLATTVANTWLLVVFLSEAEDGRFLSTHNYANSDQLDNAPGLSSRRLAGLESAADLWKAHLRHLQEVQGERSLAEQSPEGFVDLLARLWDTKTAWACRKGYLKEEGDRYRGGVKLALLIGRNNMNPFRMEGGKPSRVALRLVLAAVGTLACAVVLERVLPFPDRELGFGALFLLLAMAIPVLFPRSQGYPFVYCSVPAHAYLELRTNYGPAILLAGMLVSSLLGAVQVAVKYRRSVTRMRVTPPSSPPMSVAQKGVGGGLLLVSLLLAFVIQALVRDPRWTDPRIQGPTFLFLGTNGLLLSGLISLMIIPAMRRKRSFRLWMVACAGSFIIFAGEGVGELLKAVDQSVSASRLRTVKAAVDQFTAQRGKLPKRLEDLVPDFLPQVPRPLAGFSRQKFMYMTCPEGFGGPGYTLAYFSPEGRKGTFGSCTREQASDLESEEDDEE
jgi:hypothetical protein